MPDAVIPSFPHVLAGNCGSGALRDLLQLNGLTYFDTPLREGAVLGLGGGLAFHYAPQPTDGSPFYVLGRSLKFEREVAAHLGFTVAVHDSEDAAEGWRRLRHELDEGRPPVVWADIIQLEYLRVKVSNARHTVVVAGYDDRTQSVWIADNDREDLQRCSYASLSAARNSDGFLGPARNRLFAYTFPNALAPPVQAVSKALAAVVRNMRGDDADIDGLDATQGLAGIEQFRLDYARWTRLEAPERARALSQLDLLIRKAGSGGALCRSLYAQFAEQLAVLPGLHALAPVARHYHRLSERWAALARHARQQDHESGIAVLEDIARLEREGVATLERCASTLKREPPPEALGGRSLQAQ